MSFEPISYGSSIAGQITTVSEPQIPQYNYSISPSIQKQKIPEVSPRKGWIPDLKYLFLSGFIIIAGLWVVKTIAQNSSKKEDNQ
ncbi:MAG: hypothetical protein P9M03_11960 [Candidatus Theseobacter exili]|nr:hypothetical protein [Candidatus Theseobacter exili]